MDYLLIERLFTSLHFHLLVGWILSDLAP